MILIHLIYHLFAGAEIFLVPLLNADESETASATVPELFLSTELYVGADVTVVEYFLKMVEEQEL